MRLHSSSGVRYLFLRLHALGFANCLRTGSTTAKGCQRGKGGEELTGSNDLTQLSLKLEWPRPDLAHYAVGGIAIVRQSLGGVLRAMG